MSEQAVLSSPHAQTVGYINSHVSNLVRLLRAMNAARKVHVRAKSHELLREYSAERLASFGWSPEEIRRLKNV